METTLVLNEVSTSTELTDAEALFELTAAQLSLVGGGTANVAFF